MTGLAILVTWITFLAANQALGNFENNEISKFSYEGVEKYINNLDYDPDQLLKFESELVEVPKKNGSLDGNRFVVISYDKKSVNSSTSDFLVDDAGEQKVFGGSLLLANSHLVDGKPDFVKLQTKRLNYHFGNKKFQIFPSFSNYQSTLNNYIKSHNKDFEPITSWKHKLVHSREQLKAEFGLNQDLDNLGINFDAIKNKSQAAVIYQFKQIFFNVTLDPQNLKVSKLFAESVTSKKLAEKNVNSQNPLLVVDSVSYGNLGYLILTTSSTNDSSLRILDNAREKMYDFLEDLNLRIVRMTEGRLEIFRDLNQTNNVMELARNIIATDSKYNQTILGYPISYSAKFVKDQKQAFVHSHVEYLVSKKEVSKGGVIVLIQNGLYIAQFHLEWDEISYDDQGNEIKVRKYWHGNDQDTAITFKESIEFKGNVRSISAKAWACTFLAWKWWNSIFEEPYIPLLKYREIIIAGYSLNPTHAFNPPILE